MYSQRNYDLIQSRSTRAVFLLSAVFGISPVVIANSKFRISYFLLFYCIIAISASFLLGCASKVAVAQRLKNSSADAFMVLFVTANSGTHIINVYLSCCAVRGLNIAMKKMKAVDNILSQISVPDNIKLDSWLEINLIFFYWINYGLHTGYGSTDDFFFSLSGTYFALISAEFLIFGKYIMSRFKVVIDKVSLLQSSATKKVDLNVETLIYARLCDVQKDFNSIFSFRFALLTLTVLFYTTSRLHITYNRKDFWTVGFAYRINSLLFYWVIFLRVVDCTTKVSRKSKQFNEILYRLMIEDKTNTLLSNRKLRLHISMKSEVIFSAGGLFNMNYTLVHSVIAAATTYVAILVQFQKK